MRKEGERLIIEPKPQKRTLAEVFASLEPPDEPFPEIEDCPPEAFEV